MQMRITTVITKVASDTSSHPGSLFQFLLPKNLHLPSPSPSTHTNKVACSSFHELINRKKNLDEERLAEPSSDAAMKDRLKTDGSSQKIFTHVT